MAHLLDTGVLLRLFDRTDPAFVDIRDCVRKLRSAPGGICIAMQNLAEFWNVTTRPATARGGYGVALSLAAKRLRFLESIGTVLYPSPQSLDDRKQLLIAQRVQGVQVHDAHLAAVMRVAGATHVVTLNKADFVRYPGIIAVTPAEFLASWSAGSASHP